MNAHALSPGAPGLLGLVATWVVMMSAMMAPTVWPWLTTFARMAAPVSGWPRVRSASVFASGYLVAWALYSIALALAQRGLERAGGWDPIRGLSPWLAAAVLAGAGVYQLAPIKRACLRHCRNPLSYFLARWRNGPSGFRLGFSHGLYCVGCCWVLMATALAIGVMNLVWMALLAAVVFAEQVLPGGQRIRIALGVALMAGAVMRMA